MPSFFQLKKLKKKEGVTTVLDLRASRPIDTPHQLKEKLHCFLLGLNYQKKPANLYKGLPDIEYFKDIAKDIKNNTKTYIHCTCGAHRASFVAQAIEIINNNKNVQQAVEDIKNSGYFDFKKSISLKVRDFLEKDREPKRKISMKANLDSFEQMFSANK